MARGIGVTVAPMLTLVAFSGLGLPTSAVESSSHVIPAVGDVACAQDPGNNPHECRDDDVGNLAYALGLDRFLVLGDIQYEYGELDNFFFYYDRYFGRLKPITAPVPGNHD